MQCQCLKASGTQCTRSGSTREGDNPRFCWQHQNCKDVASAAQEETPLEKSPTPKTKKSTPKKLELHELPPPPVKKSPKTTSPKSIKSPKSKLAEVPVKKVPRRPVKKAPASPKQVLKRPLSPTPEQIIPDVTRVEEEVT